MPDTQLIMINVYEAEINRISKIIEDIHEGRFTHHIQNETTGDLENATQKLLDEHIDTLKLLKLIVETQKNNVK